MENYDFAWNNFKGDKWKKSVDVRSFIQNNYQPYEGAEDFLEGATSRTLKLLAKLESLLTLEKDYGGVLDIDCYTVSSLTSYRPGYIDKESEIIVGLQTDRPLKRGVNPFSGIKMTRRACEAYGYTLSEKIENEFTFRTTHNDGVFRAYSEDILAARKSGLITGLPDAYGRGRIIGDYRRVALYGMDFLINEKKKDKEDVSHRPMDSENIRLLEEIYQQIIFMGKLKEMALSYGKDISKPAENAREAVQWLYFAYLGAIKEQNGAAMSLGRVSTFLDIYFERDLMQGILDEIQVQEIIDDFVLKLRMARQLRTPEYNELFAGDPMWITEAVGGMGEDGRSLVTKSSYRILNTLYNLKAAPEPNLTILWSAKLPDNFKRFVAKVSCETNSLQFENDDLMRPIFGDDYSIACCVSAMRTGKDMQYFGARANLPKLLLMSLNGGKDEITGIQTGPLNVVYEDEYLDYDKVNELLDFYRPYLAKTYVKAMNIIHYMHDKYAYEKTQMAFHDTDVRRFLAFGVAGLSCLVDSLSAVKYAKVRCIRNDSNLINEFEIEGEYPAFGNNDDRVDEIAKEQIDLFYKELCKNPAYRDATHTLSVLTITSNIVYGQKTGSTPCGRKRGDPFAPGANPMHGREKKGAVASMSSVSKIPYDCCRDGISNTFSIFPEALGRDDCSKYRNLAGILDGYFEKGGHHLNVNVINPEMLEDAYENPDRHPNLTIRVSGYAVNFNKLTKLQQREVIKRTYHKN